MNSFILMIVLLVWIDVDVEVSRRVRSRIERASRGHEHKSMYQLMYRY